MRDAPPPGSAARALQFFRSRRAPRRRRALLTSRAFAPHRHGGRRGRWCRCGGWWSSCGCRSTRRGASRRSSAPTPTCYPDARRSSVTGVQRHWRSVAPAACASRGCGAAAAALPLLCSLSELPARTTPRGCWRRALKDTSIVPRASSRSAARSVSACRCVRETRPGASAGAGAGARAGASAPQILPRFDPASRQGGSR